MNTEENTIEFLSTDELAVLLKVSKTSIYRLMGRRLIPFYKIGHNVRFKKSDVLEFLNKNCINSVT